MVQEQLNLIREEIDRSMSVAGRKDPITLVAVTKMVDMELVQQAILAGVLHVGENKVQELLKKRDILGEQLQYHLIGHLQTNKVKKIIGMTSLIHSVDSIRLLEEIQRRSEEKGVVTDILAEINISEEQTKTGMAESDILPFVEQCCMMSNVRLKGLMTMAPYTDDDMLIRSVFRKAYEIRSDIQKRHYENITMEHLSMGMSHDYKIALEEGATIIRIGSKIFGERNYDQLGKNE